MCIVLGQILKLNPSWDMGHVYNIAVDYINGSRENIIYLYKFPNNIAITSLYIVLFKIVTIFHITDYLTVATLFNSIIVGMSGILMYAITKRVFGNKKALMLVIILLFTTPFYLYSAIYYTDTLSMFMTLAIAYTFIVARGIKPEKRIQKILMYLLLGLVIFIAEQIKITTIFIVIAYLVYSILSKNIKELKYLICTIASLLVMVVLYNVIVMPKIISDKQLYEEIKTPIEQWIFLGIKGNGGYDQDAYDFINQFSTNAERKQAIKEKIKEQIAEYNANTFIKHLNEKLKFAWTDGTYFAPEKLGRQPVRNTIVHETVLPTGKYMKYYKYIPQVMHMSMLIFILIGAVNIIKKQNFNNKSIIFYIVMLGFILFLLLWENRSRYILTGVPFFMIAMLEGIETINTKAKKI